MIEERYIDEYAPAEPTIRLRAQPGAIAASLSDALDGAPLTARISDTLATIERSRIAPVALGGLGGILLGVGLLLLGYHFGYAVGYAAGALSKFWPYRGWAALLVFSVVGSTYMVYTCNRRAERY